MLIIIEWLMVFIENRTNIIILGLFFELIGGILLASEMIELLDKIRNWNVSLQDKIQGKKKECAIDIASVGLLFVPILLLAHIKKTFSLKEIFVLIYYISILYILILINLITIKLLHFFEYLIKKLGTKRGLGVLGVIFLCLGFIIQFYINLTTK
ncbi:MAG: hypothetical protein KAT32_05195 [Candidatus Moranbacteria bacterium]|nr:hypothetical protein [Candidatus Moranbacteria bacterium]